MCDLAATGLDGRVTLLLLVGAVVMLGVGVLLVRRSRLGVIAVLLVVGLGAGFAAPAPPARADCPTDTGAGAPPAPTTTIGLIVSDQLFAFTGPTTKTVDVVNLGSTVTALGVTLIGTPAGWTIDASACTALAPSASCSIVVSISGSALTGVWSYSVAGTNTNSVPDSMTLLELTTLTVSPSGGAFTVPGDSMAFTITNTGAVDAVLLSATLLGDDPTAYTITSNSCGSALAPGASCLVSIQLGITLGSGAADLEISALNANAVVATLLV